MADDDRIIATLGEASIYVDVHNNGGSRHRQFVIVKTPGYAYAEQRLNLHGNDEIDGLIAALKEARGHGK